MNRVKDKLAHLTGASGGMGAVIARALVLAAAAFSLGAAAQTAYPGKPIRMVVGFAPGGAADVLTRVIAQALGKQLGQQVIVENKPSADGILAAQQFAAFFKQQHDSFNQIVREHNIKFD